MIQTVYTALRDFMKYRRENRLNIIAKYIANIHKEQIFDILLYNDSTLCAYDVEYEFDADKRKWEDNDVIFQDQCRTPIPFLRPGEELRIPFVSGHQALQEPIMEPFDIVITYYDKRNKIGKKHTTRCRLDVRVFNGFAYNIR